MDESKADSKYGVLGWSARPWPARGWITLLYFASLEQVGKYLLHFRFWFRQAAQFFEAKLVKTVAIECSSPGTAIEFSFGHLDW
jgi:hypothetical protein